MSDVSELQKLAHVSAVIGSDPSLVQGAGGNTSIKNGDVLYVKASGTRLARAADEDIFVAVDLRDLRAAISQNSTCDENALLIGNSLLRASIETPLHAVIPHKAVIHVHSVAALSYAVLEEAPTDELRSRLAQFRWAWVPYAKPGWPLTWLVKESLISSPDVWILQNHGIIVAGQSIESASRLLGDVEEALKSQSPPVREPSRALVSYVETHSRWRLPVRACIHRLGIDTEECDWASGGVLSPDQAVFLGSRVIAVSDPIELESLDKEVPAVLVRGHGVVVKTEASSAADELLTCMALTCGLISAGSKVRYIPDGDVLALLNWDAEHYRQSLERKGQRASSRL